MNIASRHSHQAIFAEGKKAPKPASAKAGGGDALETLVANYRSSLFGEGSKKQKRTLSKRWFE